MKLFLIFAFSAMLGCFARRTAQTDYVIGAQDVLTITVYDQVELSGKFTVDPDGTLTFPLLGRIKAGGLTLRGLEDDLKKRSVRWLPPQPAGLGRRWRRIGASASSSWAKCGPLARISSPVT